MNPRRSFLKTLVGAFVASAIEIRLAREPETLHMPNLSYRPADYVGDYRWLNLSATPEGTGRFRGKLTNGVLDETYRKLCAEGGKALT